MIKINIYDNDLEIQENSILFFNDIPSVESDYIHKIHLDDIVNALVRIGKDPIWCNNGDAIVIKDLQSSKIKCSTQNMHFAIGSKGRNISDTLDRINYKHRTKIANLSVVKTTEPLVKVIKQ